MKSGCGLGHQYSASQLRDGLAESNRIVYVENGNRTHSAEQTLKIISPILSKVGVTRIADISHLPSYSFPVFQVTRPNTAIHYSEGMNSGSQGKGMSKKQAMISAMMETIEIYCAEPKNLHLVRGSYSWLKKNWPIVDPNTLHLSNPLYFPQDDEPLMWTWAYSLRLDTEVLVPAETVYFPFPARGYHTRPLFPCGTNGLASGLTYLEATVHALYEVIERSYLAMSEVAKIKIDCLWEDEVTAFKVNKFYRESDEEYEVQLFTFQLPWVRHNLPNIYCKLLARNGVFSFGYGCAGDVDTAIQRAISESLQVLAVNVSGSREDLQRNRPSNGNPKAKGNKIVRRPGKKINQKFPDERTLHVAEYKKQVINRTFANLHEEFLFLKKWLIQAGCPDILIANLTRQGIEIPVVKVIVPGLPHHTTIPSTMPLNYSVARMYQCPINQK